MFSTLGSRRLDDDPHRQEEVEGGQGSLESGGLEYLFERSACLLFSSKDTVSAKTLFFLLRSFTSVSCSSILTLTIFSCYSYISVNLDVLRID